MRKSVLAIILGTISLSKKWNVTLFGLQHRLCPACQRYVYELGQSEDQSKVIDHPCLVHGGEIGELSTAECNN